MLPLFNYYKNKSGRTHLNNLHIFLIILIIVTILMFIYIEDFRFYFVEKENNTSSNSSLKVNYETEIKELNKQQEEFKKQQEEFKKMTSRYEEIKKEFRKDLVRQRERENQIQIEKESYKNVQNFYDNQNKSNFNSSFSNDSGLDYNKLNQRFNKQKSIKFISD